ncbi:MAG: outer membrane protein assembly factor BamB family protein [Candidatus Bathycorpusculaceae bacterium]
MDETTGVELWRSFSFSGSPRGNVAYDNGRVYIGTSNGYVYCINAENGAKIWEKQFTGDQITTNPVVYNGKVYIGTYNGYIYALDATTGLSIPGWYYSTSNNPINSNSAVYNGILYFGCDDDKIHAINISSDAGPMLLWQFTTSGDVRSSPCIGDGKVFIGTSSTDRAILALNATTTQPSGELIWKYVLATGYTIDTTPAYVDGTLYFAIGTKAYALNANVLPGTYPEGSITIEKWTVTVGNYPTSLTVADGKVFLSNGYETLLCLNATTGITLWTYKFTTYNSEEPVIADGRLFVTQHLGVFCFGESYSELTYYYTATPVGAPFVIKLVEQNATPSSTISIDRLTTEKKINFTITGIENSYSKFNITIPNEMLGGPYYVRIDGALRSHTPTDNGTHTSLYFTYYHTDNNPHNVEITGTTVIPEFSSLMISSLLLILSLIALVLAKTKQSRN